MRCTLNLLLVRRIHPQGRCISLLYQNVLTTIYVNIRNYSLETRSARAEALQVCTHLRMCKFFFHNTDREKWHFTRVNHNETEFFHGSLKTEGKTQNDGSKLGFRRSYCGESVTVLFTTVSSFIVKIQILIFQHEISHSLSMLQKKIYILTYATSDENSRFYHTCVASVIHG